MDFSILPTSDISHHCSTACIGGGWICWWISIYHRLGVLCFRHQQNQSQRLLKHHIFTIFAVDSLICISQILETNSFISLELFSPDIDFPAHCTTCFCFHLSIQSRATTTEGSKIQPSSSLLSSSPASSDSASYVRHTFQLEEELCLASQDAQEVMGVTDLTEYWLADLTDVSLVSED